MHQQQTAFKTIVGKGEIARNEHFLLFPQCFLSNQIIVYPFVHIFEIISLFAAELEEPNIGISGKGLTRQIQDLMNLKIRGSEKVLGKERTLVTSVFSLSKSCFVM